MNVSVSTDDRRWWRHQILKRKTAAYEARVICRKLYPWRIK